ncbi:tetratricopeptide repeat protein [Sulfuricurvum sp.]|uniref:tetratricopeptide repeat protein n=1 Tax=Sulfuricurvum sp. TaxID=2025608 RepID=UPI002E36C336|nr:tetratricopeptide repeat protein [Sulfuricurvum sp.]HEX5329313.1 tetratricopeptide repeat protein [Sulfuricurvum sp.]
MKKQLYIVLFFCSSLFAFDSQQSFWETYTAALRGDKIAQFQTGVIYERGIGVEENQTLAAQWFEKSAEQGYVDAQYNIAIMYASGRGVAANEGLAMMWLARAAKQKDPEARKLLLKIIDGELDGDKRSADENASVDETIVEIPPCTLITKADAMICDQRKHCEAYKANSALTSVSKRGEFYKISGTVTKKGWKPYVKEGWIDEASVEVRR